MQVVLRCHPDPKIKKFFKFFRKVHKRVLYPSFRWLYVFRFVPNSILQKLSSSESPFWALFGGFRSLRHLDLTITHFWCWDLNHVSWNSVELVVFCLCVYGYAICLFWEDFYDWGLRYGALTFGSGVRDFFGFFFFGRFNFILIIIIIL